MESVFLSHMPTYVVSPSVIPACSVVVAVGILNISCRRCPLIVALQAKQRPKIYFSDDRREKSCL